MNQNTHFLGDRSQIQYSRSTASSDVLSGIGHLLWLTNIFHARPTLPSPTSAVGERGAAHLAWIQSKIFLLSTKSVLRLNEIIADSHGGILSHSEWSGRWHLVEENRRRHDAVVTEYASATVSVAERQRASWSSAWPLICAVIWIRCKLKAGGCQA